MGLQELMSSLLCYLLYGFLARGMSTWWMVWTNGFRMARGVWMGLESVFTRGCYTILLFEFVPGCVQSILCVYLGAGRCGCARLCSIIGVTRDVASVLFLFFHFSGIMHVC
jgi:hypothetical protein